MALSTPVFRGSYTVPNSAAPSSSVDIGTAGTDRLIIVTIHDADNSSVSALTHDSCTIGGNSATKIHNFETITNDQTTVSAWYIQNDALSGSQTIAATISGAADNIVVGVHTIEGVDTVTPTSATDGAGATGAVSYSDSITTINANSVIIQVFASEEGNDRTLSSWDGSFTELFNTTYAAGAAFKQCRCGAAYFVTTTAGAKAYGATLSAEVDHLAWIAFEINEGGGTSVSVSATNVSSAAAIGDEAINLDWIESFTNVSSSAAVGDEAINLDWVESVTNVSSAATIGDETILSQTIVSVTNVSSAAAVGNETIALDWVESVTSVSSVAAVGDEIINFDWVESFTNVSAVAEIGDETILSQAIVSLTNISSAADVGDETIIVGANVNVVTTGLSSTAAVGDETINFDWVESVTAVSSVSAVGDETINSDIIHSVTNVSSAAAVGDETIILDWVESVTSVSSVAEVGDEIAYSATHVSVSFTNVSSAAEIGDETISVATGISVGFTNVSADAEVGNETISLPILVPVTSVSSTAGVGSVSISIGWLNIYGDSANLWGSVSDGTSNLWEKVG